MLILFYVADWCRKLISQIGLNKEKSIDLLVTNLDKYLSETNDIYIRKNKYYFLYFIFFTR